MTSYNILEARNNLSRLVASAESGVEVTITRRGVPVAKIVPVPGSEPEKWTGARLIEWLETHPIPPDSRRTTAQIEDGIRESRESWE